MQPLRLCVFLASIAVLRCYELSQNLAEFYCVFNGNYSYREQVVKDGAERMLRDYNVQPVLAPALSPIPVLYVEYSKNGVLVPPYIFIVTEGEDGTVFTTQYNFSGNTATKPGTFDVNQIKSLTVANLQRQQHCKDSYQRFEPFAFTAKFQDCRRAKVNGEWETCNATLTCNKINMVIHVGAPEKHTLLTYQKTSNGNKFPLENAPSNYVCNCDNTTD